MSHAVDVGIHHVGHVVADMAGALDLYRRLGFTVPPPSCPAIESGEGVLRPFGAANTHADFRTSFLEVVSLAPGGEDAPVPAGARLVPLRAPAEALARVVAQIESTTADLAARLERFEGCHVLVLATSDIDAVADRLTTAGVGHGGVTSVRRAVETPSGTRVETVRVLELGQGTADPPPEGRIGFAAQLDPEIQGSRELTHPNGTSGIADVLLCVAADELDRTEARYRTYLDRSARTADHGRTFDLDDGASLTLVGERELGRLLPGGRPAALPALVGCAVRVEDLATTTSLLEQAGFALRRTADGAVVVPADEARGVAVIFR